MLRKFAPEQGVSRNASGASFSPNQICKPSNESVDGREADASNQERSLLGKVKYRTMNAKTMHLNSWSEVLSNVMK